ncbi:ferrous iron transport protein B [Planctomycetota bacterium]|nr:ferrous iron transport protein B [Planctomycetota bacterium]
MPHFLPQTLSVPVRTIALAGNPNAGKTSLFNALTGLRQKVANYAGVTVDKKTGPARTPAGPITVIDLPGTYSLEPVSPDERVAAEVLRGQRTDTPAPDVIIAVIDASNLARNLLLFTQLADLHRPLIVALTMPDVATSLGRPVDPAALARDLGVPVVPVVSYRGQGVSELLSAIDRAGIPAQPWSSVAQTPVAADTADAADPVLADIAGRYQWIDRVVEHCVQPGGVSSASVTDRVDAVLMHPVFGLGIFAAIMTGLFLTIFIVADPLMSGCENAVAWLGALATSGLSEGLFKDLIERGVFGGVGSVVVFAPQIALLFILLGLLEDSGYLARAAFLMDRLLSRVGLHGKSFIPLLSSFACAIPGIMSARSIQSPRDRLATILVAPFMSCSARLPVYLLLVGTFFGHWSQWGRGGLMLGLYVLGIAAAAAIAWLFSRTRAAGPSAPFILELPRYQWPKPGNVGLQAWQYTRAFLVRAGTIIFALSILLWAAATFPRPTEAETAARTAAFEQAWTPPAPQPAAAEPAAGKAEPPPSPETIKATALEQHLAGEALAHSAAGRFGHLVEPLIAPLGFDWKMGVGLVGAFAAREVFVATMGIVYRVGDSEDDTAPLSDAMTQDRRPDGSPTWTPLVALSMLVWFVLAMQCISTTAVVRRETGGWTWPLIQLVSMNLIAYAACLVIYQGGRALGF